MTEVLKWQPIATAPRDGTEIPCCWVGKPDYWVKLMWKTNRRIVDAHASGHDFDLPASYFGDPVEYDDYEVATNQPTHWFCLPVIPTSEGAP